jgi:hypothetical protein
MTLRLDADGLQTETLEQIIDGLATELIELYGPNFRARDAKAMAGQLVNAVGETASLAQQQLLATYASMDPDGAAGRPLDARVGLTGTRRQGATSSYVDGILTFTDAGTAPQGMLIRNEDNGTLWELTDGPHVATGAEAIAAQVTAVETGPILAQAGTTWGTVTVVPNLAGFTNPTDDANVGRDREPDPELRTRRRVELYAQGQGPLAAIQGRVSQVDGVLFCRVYHNPSTAPVDSDGIPFKAFNVVVETQPSTPTADQQQAIWEATWSAMGAGGEAFGTDFEGTIIDSEGVEQPVAFDTISIVDAVLEVDLVTTGTEDPITPNIEAVVAAKILARANAELEKHGRDVRRIDIEGIVADMLDDGEITGPYAVNVRMAISPGSPTNVARLVVGIRQKADFDSANITVAQV